MAMRSQGPGRGSIALVSIALLVSLGGAQQPFQYYTDWRSLGGKGKLISRLADLGRVDGIDVGKQPLLYEHPDLYAKFGPRQGPEGLKEELKLDVTSRCASTLGTWCKSWWTQTPIPWKPAPRGSKECAKNCNGVGNCNYDTGVCQCNAGWSGPDCTTRDLRVCSHRHKNPMDFADVPLHNLDENGVDKDWHVEGWTAARCGGVCDVERALCLCGEGSKYSRINAPKGSPPGTPPIRQGRPLVEPCQPSTDKQGRKTKWGGVEYEKLYGPHGWCNADPGQPTNHTCGCSVEGWHGRLCHIPSEVYCGNQCNLRGKCDLGYCKCDPGWYGTFCERKKAGEPIEPVSLELKEKFKEVHSEVQAALEPPPKPVRKRPLIYIYDLPSEWNTRLLQWRNFAPACVWRYFGEHNNSLFRDPGYGAEIYLHEVLSTSPHRTFDPEEADFFFVPAYLTCYLWPVYAWTDGPWYGAPVSNLRPYHAMGMMQTIKDWVAKTFPYWSKRQGRDHIFITLHDEGACYMSNDVFRNAIFLTHWGRMDMNHSSGTAYFPDDYNRIIEGWPSVKGDWRDEYRGHPCYDPKKDLVIPHFKQPGAYHMSPLLAHPPAIRYILCFFRGDIGFNREMKYSRGIRQTLFRVAHEQNWREKYRIYIGTRMHYDGDYSDLLRRSIFCIVAPGDGHSARAEDAILHGCIPVVIMDDVHAALENALDWSAFSIRVPQARIPELPEILLAINETRVVELQRNLAAVWHRFAYMTGPAFRYEVRRRVNFQVNTQRALLESVPVGHPLRPVLHYPVKQDAFHTILAWLYSRIPYTQG